MINSDGVAAVFLCSVPPGTRVVARHRVPGGFTDALGYLRSCDGVTCEIDTRRGRVTVPLANVVAAKRVPEPPARRGGPPDSGGTPDSGGPPEPPARRGGPPDSGRGSPDNRGGGPPDSGGPPDNTGGADPDSRAG